MPITESAPTAISIPQPTDKNRMLFLVKWIGIITGMVLIIYLLYRVYIYYTVKLPSEHYGRVTVVAQHIYILEGLLIPLMAILILLKSKHNTAFFLALCFIAYEINVSLPPTTEFWIELVNIFTGALAGTLAVASFQHFPQKVTPQHIKMAITFRWLQRYLIFLLNPIVIWFGFFTLLLGVSVIEIYGLFTNVISDVLIMLTAFIYLFVNLRTTTGEDNDRILWLFWGLAGFILTTLSWHVIVLFTSETPRNLSLILASANSLILVFSLGMSLFFSDAFNTGKFITQTLVSGIVFVLAILVYNTAEHYILHWVAHTLHISNVMMASLLSGVIVLVISPLHHRLAHFLEKRLKKNEIHATSHKN